MNRPILCSLLVLSLTGVHADDQVRSTQEELRRRNIYFGDVDGRPSPELESAVKHYQQRKGLPVTGADDHDTLLSLGIVKRGANEPPPKELELPDEPVLKSDTKLDVSAEAHEIASTSGISTASVTPDVVAFGRRNRAGRARTAKEHPVSESQANTGAAMPHFSPAQNGQLPHEIERYVENYLNAVSHNRLEDELHFYADRVDYLGNGWVDRRIIEHSLSKYYARWPHRSYSHIENVRYQALPGRGEIVVTFRVGFSLRNGHAKARGKTDNEIIINAATADPRIVSIKESRVR
jgi:peptidoglycan hydrolase-like protein with peptidoglycan-binding domain